MAPAGSEPQIVRIPGIAQGHITKAKNPMRAEIVYIDNNKKFHVPFYLGTALQQTLLHFIGSEMTL
jgi:hypothetical protein